MQGRATFSADGVYRYRLSRGWSDVGGRVLWVMLNPSTADAQRADPTIRRCIGFSRAWGFGGMEVVNLFALRATKPAALVTHADPVGPRNDRHIAGAAARADLVVVAWGAFAWAADRAERVRQLLGGRVACLGLTERGRPRHPLYVAGSVGPERYRGPSL